MKAMLDFKVDMRELDALRKDFQFRKPQNFAYAVRQVLNDQAFATRNMAVKNVLPRKFNIRNRFIQSSIKVNKVKSGVRDPNWMMSEAGALRKWSGNRGRPFDGLKLQEFGGTTKDKRIYSVEARGGTFSGMPKRRFWGKRETKREDEFPGTGDGRVIAMLRTLGRQNYKGMMYIRSHSKIRKGVYVFGKGTMRSTTRPNQKIKNIRMVKDLSKNSVSIKPTYWLKTSTSQAVTAQTTARFYKRAADKHLQFIIKRGL